MTPAASCWCASAARRHSCSLAGSAMPARATLPRSRASSPRRLGCRVSEDSAQALGVFNCAAANEPGFQVQCRRLCGGCRGRNRRRRPRSSRSFGSIRASLPDLPFAPLHARSCAAAGADALNVHLQCTSTAKFATASTISRARLLRGHGFFRHRLSRELPALHGARAHQLSAADRRRPPRAVRAGGEGGAGLCLRGAPHEHRLQKAGAHGRRA